MCVSVQAITLQFEFILAIKCNSTLYVSLLGALLRYCRLSSQRFKEGAVMSMGVQGVRTPKVHTAYRHVTISLDAGGCVYMTLQQAVSVARHSEQVLHTSFCGFLIPFFHSSVRNRLKGLDKAQSSCCLIQNESY